MDQPPTIITIIQNVLMDFASVIPNILGALLVLLLGWISAKIIARLLHKVLTKTGVDKVGEKINEVDMVRSSNYEFRLSAIISKTVYYLSMLVVFLVATEVLQMPVVSAMVADLIAFIPNLIAAIILFVLGMVLADFIKNIVVTACRSIGIPSANIVGNFVFYLIFLTMTITALQQANIETSLLSSNITILIAGLVAAFSIGYGVASIPTMSNYLASFYAKNRVKIGDYVRILDAEGEIVNMNSASVTLRTDEKLIIIPLKKFNTELLEIIT